ncbi:MAG TPA: fatty acid desaturase, partial [Mycobacterium sp.]|nr:fatty acid desaturase [Mycobacterium sp.]
LLVQYGKAWRTIAKLSLPNKYLSDSADDAPENPQREDVRRARATSVGTDPATGRRRGLKTAMATVRQWRRRNGLRR